MLFDRNIYISHARQNPQYAFFFSFFLSFLSLLSLSCLSLVSLLSLPCLSSQEEELRKSGETKYGHLSNDLHVLIEVFAPPGEAYSRMSRALDEIKKFLVPVSVLHWASVVPQKCPSLVSLGPPGWVCLSYAIPAT